MSNKIWGCSVQSLPHSPDLAPADIFVFSKAAKNCSYQFDAIVTTQCDGKMAY